MTSVVGTAEVVADLIPSNEGRGDQRRHLPLLIGTELAPIPQGQVGLAVLLHHLKKVEWFVGGTRD